MSANEAIFCDLAGVNDYLSLMRKYAFDFSVQPDWFYRVFMDVVDLAVRFNWKIPRKDFLRTLTNLALFEINNPLRCPRCGGKGCDACDDSCHVIIPNSWRCSILNIDKHDWSQVWGSRYHNHILPKIMDGAKNDR